jgi:ABC-type lipoprotein release transport system permease subunit
MMRRLGTLAWLVAVGCAPCASASSEPPSVLLSRQLAEAGGFASGDTIRLATEPAGDNARLYRIVGIYEPAPDPLRLGTPRLEVRLHLPDLLELTADPADPLARESVEAIHVALADPEDAAAFSRDLANRLPGLLARPTAADADAVGPFIVLERFHLAIALVTVLGSTAFLLALMVLRADERRETIGILRLLGVRRWRILLEVLLEGLAVAVAGALFGVLFAWATEGLFNAFFQWRYDTPLVFVRVTPSIAGRAVALAVPLGALAGVVASWRLLRVEIGTLVRR